MRKITPVAPVKSIVYTSPAPEKIWGYDPDVIALESGRLIATMSIGSHDPAFRAQYYDPADIGRAYVSDDKGETWRQTASYPITQARPFTAGKAIYILGHLDGMLRVIRSDDDGETWSGYSVISKQFEGYVWHQSPCNVCYVEDRVYLVMERYTNEERPGWWHVRAIAPILMRANVNDDLTKEESWSFAAAPTFEEVMDYDKTDYFGIPFYSLDHAEHVNVGNNRFCAPIGWLETNVIHIEDPTHIWYDPTGRTFHLIMRAHTGLTNMCCVAKVVEHDDGSMKLELIKTPSGKTMMYLPMPGGHMKFYILYDEKTKLYWHVGTQSTDSMIKPECMPDDRFETPNNERQRMVLHFSKNCVDWCFAALVDIGDSQRQARHYAGMCIDGDNLCLLSRSGDERAKSAHDGDIITFHEIKNFRELVY